MSKNLIFNLKHKWFKYFECGWKRYEFREIKPYWQKRFCEYYSNDNDLCKHSFCNRCLTFKPKEYDKIILKDGYPRNERKDKIIKKSYAGIYIDRIRINDYAEKEMIGKYHFVIICRDIPE